MRAALGAALFVKPNLLLLDEPTNHLDLHALCWLEKWLTQGYQGIAVIVSHDQHFLDEVCTDVLELRSTLAGQKSSSLTHYSGDYMTYVNTVEERRVAQTRAKAALDMKKDKLREFIGRDGKKYDNPAHQAQRKMKMKQLESMDDIEEPATDPELVINLPKPYGVFEDNEKMVAVNNVSYGWGEGEEGLLFKDIDFVVNTKSRFVVLGKNGCGKTCLLNLLTGELDPLTGTVTRHLGSRVTILHQHHYRGEQLDPNLSPLDHIRRMTQDEGSAVGKLDPGSREEETRQRAYLSSFGITGGRAMIPVKYLSGGQRMRVAMASALFRRPDVLILDEPTNHLDSDTVRALCDALDSYEGSIIAVSHDEAFVNRIMQPKSGTNCNVSGIAISVGASGNGDSPTGGQLWVMSKKRLQRFDGDFKSYKKLILKKLETDWDLSSF